MTPLGGINMAKTYFYMRISTKEANDKQSFNRQDKALKKYAESNGLQYDQRTVFRDDVSGSTFNRPDWIELESSLHKNDTVVFKEISRFTRDAAEGYIKYMKLMDMGVNLIFLDNATVCTDYIKQLTRIAEEQDLVAKTALEGTIKLLLIVELDRVQKERETIVARIKQGIQASKKVQGRRKGQLDKMSDELRDDIIRYRSDRSIKQVDLMKKHNISRNTLKKYIKCLSDK